MEDAVAVVSSGCDEGLDQGFCSREGERGLLDCLQRFKPSAVSLGLSSTLRPPLDLITNRTFLDFC